MDHQRRSTSAERDELIKIIERARESWATADTVADEILAAGWRKVAR